MLRISMVSLTYVNKAKKLMDRLGYKSTIVHNVTPKGCEYTLHVDAPQSVVLTTLKREGIPIKRLL
jgi:hypothetical protein